MLIVDSQIHIWKDGKMSAHHRQIPTSSKDDALAEMASAGVDCAVIHPPSSLGESVNVLAVEAVRRHPDKFCILGHFDLQSPDREKIVARWRERPGMLGFRFTFNQPQQKAWWTDGSLDWLWAACEKAALPVGLLAGGNMAELEQLRVVVGEVERVFSVLGIERGADALGVARPFIRHFVERQAHRVAHDAALSLVVDRGALLRVSLLSSLSEQVVDAPVVGEV